MLMQSSDLTSQPAFKIKFDEYVKNQERHPCT